MRGTGRLQIELSSKALGVLSLLAKPGEALEQAAARLIEASTTRHFVDLTPADFEALICRALDAQGYQVDHLGGRGDEGVDVLATRGSEKIAIQCKRYDGSLVTPNQVREFLGAIVACGAARGVFVTTSSYSEAAKTFAISQGIELVDGSSLLDWLTAGRVGLSRKALCSKCGAAAANLGEWTRAWVCAVCKEFNTVV